MHILLHFIDISQGSVKTHLRRVAWDV